MAVEETESAAWKAKQEKDGTNIKTQKPEEEVSDLFMNEVVEICQEAIDGGYSKTKHLCILWDPKLGVVELRGVDKTKLLATALDKYPDASRLVICIQRKHSDECYVVAHAFVVNGMMHSDDYRVYPPPLSADNWEQLTGLA